MSFSRVKLLLSKPPPIPLTLPDLTLSAYSYSNALGAGTDFAVILGNDLGATLSITPVDGADTGKVALTGDQTALEVGTTASTTGTDEYDLISTLPGAVNSPHTQRISLTVTPATQTPVVNNVTLPVGVYTPPGMGTVLIKNIPGLVDPVSPQIISWRMGSVTAGAGGLATDLGALLTANTPFATARTPRTTRGAITEVTTNRLPGANYTIPLIAVGEDGSEATCTLTIAPVAGAVSRGDDLTWPGADGAAVIQGRLASKMSGLKLLISVGHVDGAFYTLTNLTQAGRVTIEYADPARPCRIGAADFYVAPRISLLNVGIGGMKANKVFIRNNSVEFYASGLYPLGASVDDVTVSSQAGVKFASGSNDGLVENCRFAWVGRGCEFGDDVLRSRFLSNAVENYYGDATAAGRTTDCEASDNIFLHVGRLPGTADHSDGLQLSDPQQGQTLYVTRFKFLRNVVIQGAGNAGSIGVHNGSTMGIDCEIRNNVYVIRAQNVAQFGRHSGAIITDNTFFLTASGLIGQHSGGTPGENDNIWYGVQDMRVSETGSSGSNLLARNVTVGGMMAQQPTWTFEDNIALGMSYPAIKQWAQSDPGDNHIPMFRSDMPTGRTNDFTGIFAAPNAFEKLSNYYDGPDPDVIGTADGALWGAMDPFDARDLVLDTLAPALGGDLVLPGGEPAGAINFDKTLKTA